MSAPYLHFRSCRTCGGTRPHVDWQDDHPLLRRAYPMLRQDRQCPGVAVENGPHQKRCGGYGRDVYEAFLTEFERLEWDFQEARRLRDERETRAAWAAAEREESGCGAMTRQTIYGLDGREMLVETREDRCEWRILLPEDADRLDAVPVRCAATAIRLSVDPGAGRNLVSECLCDEHGGTDRAFDLLRRDWAVVAPLVVGDDQDVIEAGMWSLTTTEAVVRIYRERDELIADRWDVAIIPEDLPHRPGHVPPTRSFGSESIARDWAEAMTAIALRSTITNRPAGVRARPRPWIAQLGVGSHIVHVGAFESRDAAIDAGVAAWRANLARVVAQIRDARGGTLDWGMPVQPRSEPVIIESLPGESSWDTYERCTEAQP